MPWHGYAQNNAPNLSKLAQQSVRYTRAYSLSSYTAMSVGGFLSGRYPGELHRSGYFFSGYPDKVTFFPELLQKAGVRTMAGHAHFYFDPARKKKGLDQGFSDYRMLPGLSVHNHTDKNVTSPQHVAMAIDILGKKNTNEQFFSWFHFMDPHDEYVKHNDVPAFKAHRKSARNRYDGEIYYTDRHLGNLFDYIAAQPWANRTAIVISSDHGEAFGEHGRSRHGFFLWEVLVRVPLLFRIPGVAGKTIDKARSHIDLAPTIFELMGQPIPSDWQGKSLLAEIKGKQAPEDRDVVVDLPRTTDNFRYRALIHKEHKIIARGDDWRFDVFNVVKDPGEHKKLNRLRPKIYKQMKKRYLDKVKTIQDVCPRIRKKLKGKRPNKPC